METTSLRKNWTVTELQIIKERYPTESVDKLAYELGSTAKSIYAQAALMKVKKKWKEPNAVAAVKVLKVFQILIILLHKPLTMKSLIVRSQLPQRTVYRYLDLIKYLGIPVEKDEYQRLYVPLDQCPLCKTTNNHSELKT